MTQAESYDLQTRTMSSQQQSNNKIFGRFDPIHIVLAITTIIFLILSIVFIVLFATKHDSSTGFLATGFSPNKSDEISSELQGLLNNKYTVNSFALDVQNQAVSAVFSLRDWVSTDDVQKVLSGSKLVSQVETTHGEKATQVCHQQQIFPSTAAQTTTVKVTTAPVTTTTGTTTQAPMANKYCKSNAVTRDILLVVDLNDLKKNNHTEKMASLQSISAQLQNGLIFPQANVFLKAVVGDQIQDVSSGFSSSSAQLIADFDALFQINNYTDKASLDFNAVLKNGVEVFRNGRSFVPGAIFVLTDKPSAGLVNVNPRDSGIFVGIAGVRAGYMNQYSSYIDQVVALESWTELAAADPFSTLVCSFYTLPAAQLLKSRYQYPLEKFDGEADTTKCQVLDIIIAFDTSESLSRLIMPIYRDFAKKVVAQYKYKDDDFTRVGILTFNDAVKEPLKLTAGTSLDVVNAAIDTVEYTAGLTDVTNVLKKAKDIFTAESSGARSKLLIVLSDAVPTVDTYADEIAAGQALSTAGVATFFVGYSKYSDEVINELGKVTKPEYVFGDTSDASLKGITQEILVTYPCPVPKCVTSYYAIEISEATNDYVEQHLVDILSIAEHAAAMQSDTASYQLVTYNEDNTNFFPQGDSSFASFAKFINSLLSDTTKIANLRGGNTRLDTAIDDISAAMAAEAVKNVRFSANILFFGEANDAVLDPNKDTAGKRALLTASAAKLKDQTAGLVYVVDDSRPVDLFGPVLWDSVTSAKQIVVRSDDVEASLKTTDFFTTWSKLSCSLPALATCYDTQLDVAVLFDLQAQDDDFTGYVSTLLSRFSSEDDAHFCMLGYGAQKTTVLASLQAHSDAEVQGFGGLFEDWRNGSYFITTTTTTTTTTVATTSEATQKPAQFWLNNLYTVDKSTISGVFDTLSTQFGCTHYSEDGDRLFAPNLFIFASDNFATYTDAVWDDFKSEVRTRYGCWDCAATPTFLFLSKTDDAAPVELGVTVKLSKTDLDIDASDDTSTQANINKFNNLVNSVCTARFPDCSSYTCTVN